MSVRTGRFGIVGSGRGKAAAAVMACAVMLLAGCGGSGGSAAETAKPVLRGAVATYALGATGPGGGVVFYVATTPFACGTDLSLGVFCTYLEALTSEAGQVAWCSDTRTDVGANGTAIGTGAANTQSMVTTGGCTSGAGYSAANTDSGGFTDWYLPSTDELYALWKKRSLSGLAGTFVIDTYWSSSQDTQFPAQTAKDLGWAMGSFASVDKAQTHYYRVVRAF